MDEEKIRKLIEEWAAAVRIGDLEKIISNHTDDMVMFDVPPPLQSKGLKAYAQTWDLFFQYSPKGEGSFNLSELEITASDSVAFAHALIGIMGSQARLTIGLRKVDGQWYIAHEHHSYPLSEAS